MNEGIPYRPGIHYGQLIAPSLSDRPFKLNIDIYTLSALKNKFLSIYTIVTRLTYTHTFRSSTHYLPLTPAYLPPLHQLNTPLFPNK